MIRTLRKLRPLISPELEYSVRRTALSLLPKTRPQFDNVYHMCTWKTGSQWVRLVMSDPRFSMTSGYLPKPMFHPYDVEYDPTAFKVRKSEIVTNGFISNNAFQSLPKVSDNFRGFYVTRDPGELLVSWYMSTRYSHIPDDIIRAERAELDGLDDHDGLFWAIEKFDQIYDRVKSWHDYIQSDPRFKVYQFERLVVGKNQEDWDDLLAHLGITIAPAKLQEIFETYSAEKLSTSGKKRDITDKYANRGARRAGEHLTAGHWEAFNKTYPDLNTVFGYAT